MVFWFGVWFGPGRTGGKGSERIQAWKLFSSYTSFSILIYILPCCRLSLSLSLSLFLDHLLLVRAVETIPCLINHGLFTHSFFTFVCLFGLSGGGGCERYIYERNGVSQGINLGVRLCACLVPDRPSLSVLHVMSLVFTCCWGLFWWFVG